MPGDLSRLTPRRFVAPGSKGKRSVGSWHIRTSEYSPHLGGVADYTQLVATGLAEAGDEVHVWCPAEEHNPQESTTAASVTVHRELGHFSVMDLHRAGRLLD